MRVLVAFVAGLVFGLGLLISDMANPARVLAFLTLGAGWDPTLIFVMAGAMAVAALAWIVRARRAAPVFGGDFPAKPGDIDQRLLTGAAVFGVGWGLVGVCPGPALAAVAVAGWPMILFIAAMLAGMLVDNVWPRAIAKA